MIFPFMGSELQFGEVNVAGFVGGCFFFLEFKPALNVFVGRK